MLPREVSNLNAVPEGGAATLISANSLQHKEGKRAKHYEKFPFFAILKASWKVWGRLRGSRGVLVLNVQNEDNNATRLME